MLYKQKMFKKLLILFFLTLSCYSNEWLIDPHQFDNKNERYYRYKLIIPEKVTVEFSNLFRPMVINGIFVINTSPETVSRKLGMYYYFFNLLYEKYQITSNESAFYEYEKKINNIKMNRAMNMMNIITNEINICNRMSNIELERTRRQNAERFHDYIVPED
jgi:hypothetical protein